jgi:GNAT superfamily N-acetyltransferase
MREEHSIGVRKATIADLDRLAPLFDAYRQFYRKPSDLELARRFLLHRFQHNESIIFLAERPDGPAVGFTQLYPSFSSASAARILILNDLFVHPDARRQRVGSLLLAAAGNYGQTIGAVRLTLSTEVTNHAAQALYEAEGWKRQTDFYTYNLALDPPKSSPKSTL